MAQVLPSEPIRFDAGHITASGGRVPILGENWKATPRTGRASIVVGRYKKDVVVTVHGKLDLAKAEALGAVLADLIDGQGNLSVIVDLHDATAADADCLWVFTDAAERAHRRGGRLMLNEPPDSIHSGLHLRGLDRFVGGSIDHDCP
jgi:anti-anti-sigma factor